MKYLFPLASFFLFSCASRDGHNALLKPSNLSSFFIKVDHSKDQLVRTPKGAVVMIRSNTFDKDVDLEIKEAYTMKDILLAGLHTESNGKPLKSGGMIYINTKNGEGFPLKRPISVVIPATSIDSSMSLYKGELQKDSTIKWLPADTLQPTIASANIKAGKELFVHTCASCHAIRKDVVAPALAGLESRGAWKNHKEVLKWINNPPGYMAKDRSGYTISLKNKYAVMMVSFPQLKQKDIDNLLAFIRNEEKQQVTDTFALPYVKPCNGFDTIYYNEKDTMTVPEGEIAPLADTSSNFEIQSNDEATNDTLTIKDVSDGAYRFEMKTLGWYNVDAELAPQPNVVLCELKVVTSGTNGDDALLNAYAFFPKNKSLSVGINEGNKKFSFEKVKNKMPLYLGEKGVIVVFGNIKDQFFFGTKLFTVQKSQTLNVPLSSTKQEEFLKLIRSEQLEGINFDVIKQKMRLVPCNGSAATDSSATKQ